MTCKDFENGFCKNTKRPPIKLFCERLCKGRKQIWSLWLEDIQSKVRPEQKGKITTESAGHAKTVEQLPDWFTKIKWAQKHAKEILRYLKETGRILVSDEWKAARLVECDDCEKLWLQPASGQKICHKCGCNLIGLVGDNYGMADFEALSCKLWDAVDEKYKKDFTTKGTKVARATASKRHEEDEDGRRLR